MIPVDVEVLFCFEPYNRSSSFFILASKAVHLITVITRASHSSMDITILHIAYFLPALSAISTSFAKFRFRISLPSYPVFSFSLLPVQIDWIPANVYGFLSKAAGLGGWTFTGGGGGCCC